MCMKCSKVLNWFLCLCLNVGAQPIASIVNLSDLTNYTGWVTAASHHIKFNKSYLLLKQSKSSVITYFLCGSWEEKVLEMKVRYFCMLIESLLHTCINSRQHLRLLLKFYY